MMNHRHPSRQEQTDIAELFDKIGAVELLRVIGALVRDRHPDLTKAQDYNAELLRVAKAIDEDKA